jgi:hypothetical protein
MTLSFMPPEEHAVTIRCRYDAFQSDNLGNIYTIREDELVKFLPAGKVSGRYSNLKLGKISSVDVTNPLKILLYYRDFQQIVFLDNQLSLNSESVSLEKLGYEQTDLVCASANNSFWIYNKQNNELIRFNEQSRKISSTGNLRQLLNDDITPVFMVEHNGYLYLSSPASGIYVFDIFGAFSKIISLKGLQRFQVEDRLLYYQKDSAMCGYDQVLLDQTCRVVPGNLKPACMSYNARKLFLGFRDSIMAITAVD